MKKRKAIVIDEEAPASTSTSAEEAPKGNLEARIRRLENESKEIQSFLGLKEIQVESAGVCPKDHLEGTKTAEEEFSGKKYTCYKDEKEHEWCDMEEREAPAPSSAPAEAEPEATPPSTPE